MHCLKPLMEDDSNLLLIRQIYLYLPLVDMLECKNVSRVWWSHIRALFRSDSYRWLHVHLADKMAAEVNSAVGGSVVQEVHLGLHYQELTNENYALDQCDLFKKRILLKFRKTEQALGRMKFWFYIIDQDNVHEVQYRTEFAGIFGYHFIFNASLVIWWYNKTGEDYLNISFKVIDDLTCFREKFYTTTVHASDFVSPLVALHELISRDESLRSAIKVRFPGFNFHIQLTQPSSVNVYLSTVRDHQIFYYTKPCQKSTPLWVLYKRTMKVECQQITCKSDWVCQKSNNIPEIHLHGYRHPIAVFYIKTNNSFAVWDLIQPGHPRHVCFGIKIPREPWHGVRTHMNKSKWLIEFQETERTSYIYVRVPFTSILRNSSESCQCLTHFTQACHLEQSKESLKASSSSHQPKNYVYYVGDRYLVQKTVDMREVYIRDCWKPRD